MPEYKYCCCCGEENQPLTEMGVFDDLFCEDCVREDCEHFPGVCGKKVQ